jgi:L-lactate dehydrogenase complex protein LldG
MSGMDDMLQRVRSALGRGAASAPPEPPALDPGLIRIMESGEGLVGHFVTRARQNRMEVELVEPAGAARRIVEIARTLPGADRAGPRLAVTESEMFDRLGVPQALRQAGIDARPWGRLTLGELYDMDCGLTDVYLAVAELGALAIRPSPGHGRALSLVPPVHVAVVQREQIIPDLADLLAAMERDGVANYTTIITGPSKTADIEMTMVQGVHGPGVVKILVV